MPVTINDTHHSEQSLSESSKPIIQPRALTQAQAAAYCGISEHTLREGRLTGKRANRMSVPRHTALGPRRVVYLIEDLDAWLEKRRAATEYFGDTE